MPSTASMKAMNAVHRALIALTGGRAGWDVRGMPVLELTTTGRKTGQARTNLLTSPARIGGDPVVVASRGGDDAHPAWYLNLRDQPEVLVAERGRPAEPRHARILAGEERAVVWERVIDRYPHYAAYQSKTTREIPLVVLERV